MATMEITPALQIMMDLLHPGLSPRQQASQARNDLIALYAQRLKTRSNGTTAPEPPAALPMEQPRDIADRIASEAPNIDDGNWTLLRNSIRSAGWWDTDVHEPLLLVELRKPFVDALNEYRVQHGRIKAFFERHSGE